MLCPLPNFLRLRNRPYNPNTHRLAPRHMHHPRFHNSFPDRFAATFLRKRIAAWR
ncbi:hypothetical protein A3768_4399 (plasmid) [Ralstonia solanacearum]|nr:hypothetical protein A3768_4399 [Ralstonia solanacearum]